MALLNNATEKKNMSLLVANQDLYVFDVQCEIDADKLENCITFKTKDDMYAHLFANLDHGVGSVDELQDCEIIISADRKFGHWYSVENGMDIEDVETFINEYLE